MNAMSVASFWCKIVYGQPLKITHTHTHKFKELSLKVILKVKVKGEHRLSSFHQALRNMG